MRVSAEVRVRIIEKIDEEKMLVELVRTSERAILKNKGRLRILKDGTIAAWFERYDKKNDNIIVGNIGWGKYDIPQKMREQYASILDKVYNVSDDVSHEEISVLKGMVSRCIKHDQADWYTTYKYLNYPSYYVMKMYVKDAIRVRDDLRNSDRKSLMEFKEKYSFILCSMAVHLENEIQLREVNECESVENLELELWEKMSIDSWNKIRIAEVISKISPKYSLMHYLVTLEQEIFKHYIKPFIIAKGREITTCCSTPFVETSHEILCGNKFFSLEAAVYLGKQMDEELSKQSSEAIKAFYDYLGEKKEVFKEICVIAGTQLGCLLCKLEAFGEDVIKISKRRNNAAHSCILNYDEAKEDKYIVYCDEENFDAALEIRDMIRKFLNIIEGVE